MTTTSPSSTYLLVPPKRLFLMERIGGILQAGHDHRGRPYQQTNSMLGFRRADEERFCCAGVICEVLRLPRKDIDFGDEVRYAYLDPQAPHELIAGDLFPPYRSGTPAPTLNKRLWGTGSDNRLYLPPGWHWEDVFPEFLELPHQWVQTSFRTYWAAHPMLQFAFDYVNANDNGATFQEIGLVFTRTAAAWRAYYAQEEQDALRASLLR